MHECLGFRLFIYYVHNISYSVYIYRFIINTFNQYCIYCICFLLYFFLDVCVFVCVRVFLVIVIGVVWGLNIDNREAPL